MPGGKSVMGSRAKGSRPLAFEAKNPVAQMVNVFQVEAINSWEHLTQDLPRDFRAIERTRGKAAAAGALAGVIVKMLLAAFLLNRAAEETYGGTPAPLRHPGPFGKLHRQRRGADHKRVAADGHGQWLGAADGRALV